MKFIVLVPVRVRSFVALLGVWILSTGLAWAAPTLAVGNASGTSGTTVNVPVTFDPTTASVAGIQFNLTLPVALSTGAITPGTSLLTAGKIVSTSRSGNTWTFIIFGVNQKLIAADTLLNAQLTIAAGTPAGALTLPISNVLYSDPNGIAIAPGASTAGTVTVTGGTSPLPTLSMSLPSTVGLNESLEVPHYAATYVSFVWSFTPLEGSAALSRSARTASATTFNSPLKTNSLGSYGLSIGSYQVSVYAQDNADPSNRSNVVTQKIALLSVVETDFSAARVFPNPWRKDVHDGQPITFANLPLASTIQIFSVSGRLTKTLDAGAGSATWNLTNESGTKVASGIYLYLTRTGNTGHGGGQKWKGKLAIVR